MKATVTSKGQITIPLRIRQHLKLRAGSVLDFDEKSPFLVGRRVIDVKRMCGVVGCARQALKGKSVNQWLDETRGETDRK